jgi:quinoprotein glucose dehydrogenase
MLFLRTERNAPVEAEVNRYSMSGFSGRAQRAIGSAVPSKVGLAVAIAVMVVLATLGLAGEPQSSTQHTGTVRLHKTIPAAKPVSTSVFGKARVNRNPAQEQRDWPVYGGTAENNHYSPLAQINRNNVKQLAVAWSFDSQEGGGLQTTPIVVEGVLYGITPTQKVFALDAATGKLFWKFDSGIRGTQPDRGLAYWSDRSKTDGTKTKGDKRILVGVMNFVYALDAITGRPVASFGSHGRIDLRENLGREPVASQSVDLTSPGIVYRDLLIVGGRNPETLPAPPGNVRAFDVRTGKLRWSFHTIPRPGEVGYETWPKGAWKTSGAANNWAGMALDPERGIVYVPTGSAAFDFYGADRVGNDLFANCLIALNAKTGERIWHFQGVRHDIWDRDFPAAPVLLTVKRDGKGNDVDAVAQTTKQGFVYVFDRMNGTPLFPIEYRKYPPSIVPGEVAALEQPLPTRPAPYARQLLTEDILTNRTPEVHQWALRKFREFRSEGQFVPFNAGKDTVVFPGFDGGAEWGGPAVDPETGIIYVNANDVAWTGALTPNNAESGAQEIYLSQCGVCHGENRTGSPPATPSLVGLGDRLAPQQVAATIKNGKGRMPGFPNLPDDQMSALVTYLVSGTSKELASSKPREVPIKYRFTGYQKFLDPEGYPAVLPPWGTLNAINLNTGEYAWKIPLGEYPELAVKGQNNTGTENYGGPIVTAGGLLFIGATNFDKKFRAFDKSTGALLWEATLPFAGNATPVTYAVNGRQFVVIAAGGGKDPKSPSGGSYVSFALPAPGESTPGLPQAAVGALIPPNEPRIAVMGRVDTKTPTRVRVGYPGVTFRVRFEGPSLAMRASTDTTNNIFTVVVDGGTPRAVRFPSGESELELADGLAPGEHTVDVVRQTETWLGVATILGFRLAPGSMLLPSRPWAQRRMLFIGDSVTCGEAMERSPDGSGSWKNDRPNSWNAYNSYGMRLARSFDAQVHLVCYGGRGVIRDWTGRRDVLNAPQFFDLAVPDEKSAPIWLHSSYIPDVVVVSLGTNDFSLGIGALPEREEWVSSYVRFVQAIRTDYPEAHVFLTDGAIVNDADDPARPQKSVLNSYLKEASARLADPRIHIFESRHYPGDPTDLHPTAAQHAAMARDIEPIIPAVVGW